MSGGRHASRRRTSRLVRTIAPLLLLLTLQSCGLTSLRVQQLIQEGKHDEAIRKGQDWLRSTPVKNDLIGERNTVMRLVAEATLRKVEQTQSIPAYRNFRQTFKDRSLYGALIDEALALESSVVFKEVQRSNSMVAHQEFRASYPASPHTSASRSQEVQLAAAEARRRGTVDAMRTVRGAYGDWPEARHTLAPLYEEEAQAALSAAAGTGDPKALRRFRQVYTEPEWRSASEVLEVEVATNQLVMSLRSGAPLDPGRLAAFLDQYGAAAGVAATAALRETEIFELARQTDISDAWYLHRSLFPASARTNLQHERDLAWVELQQSNTPARALSFVDRYPDDPRAGEAEEIHGRLYRIAAASRAWPRATVQRQRVLPGGDVELLVDVRDCQGQRVSGLTRDLFEVYEGSSSLTVTGFQGLEDERPLDLVFALDMSGSMETEREAVRTALLEFAETFRFRNRNTRLGLISFSDQVEAQPSLTSDPTQFQSWIARLPPNSGGGTGEDTAGALARAATMSLRPGAEKVVILLSDENLQVNKAGRTALKIKVSPECSRIVDAVQCAARCKSPSCLLGCVRPVDGRASAQLARCTKRYGARPCAAWYPWQSLVSAAERCVEGHRDGDRALAPVAQALRRKDVRPYFLVPPVDANTGLPISGYSTLAREVGGTVAWVPVDSRSPEPYIAALMDIADQLSKQYVIRVRAPTSPTGLQAPTVAVRPARVWSPLANVALPPLAGLFPRPGGTARCTDFVALGADGQALASSGCGQDWARSGSGVGPIDRAVATRSSIVAVTLDGRAVELPFDHTASLAPLTGGHVLALSLTPEGTVLMAAVQGTGAEVLARARGAGTRVVGVLQQTPDPGGGAVFGWSRGGAETICYMPSPSQIACTNDGGQSWSGGTPAGLPPSAFDQRVVPLSIGGRPGTILLPLADGSVHRSIDGGTGWSLGLPPSGYRRELLAIEGTRQVVCAISPASVDCSEDWGRSWFAVGGSWEGGATAAASGADVYLAQAGGVTRLDRVVSRDLPSSAVYFATAVDEPYPSLRPFLAQVAAALAADPTLTLRVEGHADQRGTDEANDDLARRRAESVARIVASHGVDPLRIQVLSFGKRRPVRPGTSAADLARNRRVELLVLRRAPVRGWDLAECDDQAPEDQPQEDEAPEDDAGDDP